MNGIVANKYPYHGIVDGEHMDTVITGGQPGYGHCRVGAVNESNVIWLFKRHYKHWQTFLYKVTLSLVTYYLSSGKSKK